MLISFADIQQGRLIKEDIIASIRVARLGEVESGKRLFIFEKKDIPVSGGVLEFPYTFADEGLHEIFIDFAFAGHPEKIYETPDFLLDVQPARAEGNTPLIFLAGATGFLLGVILKWIMELRKQVQV